ncbi:MAG: Ldh family oxidoreductase [Chloroflexi bacterium]|nr:Ldh family oxidoreductase [Chloroflexota bacterium]
MREADELLEHFQVPDDIAVRVKPANLRSTIEQVFQKMGIPKEDAVTAADVLMFADLKGVDTHGVSNMLRAYVQGYNEKRLNPRPKMRIVKETETTAVVDGDGGLGIITCPQAMDIAIEKARKYGMGAVTIRNSGHAGAVGYHAMMAAKQDMIGWAMTAGGNAMVPTFGAEPRLGTNPIAFSAPASKEPFFLFDAATTTIAGNKIGLLRRLGRPLEPGWVSHPDGTPDMRGGQEPEFAAGSVRYQLPLGSTRELGSHKGFSLAVIVDILCGVLSGAAGFDRADRSRRGHFVAAYRIDAFVPIDEFKKNMDGFLRTLRETRPAPGHDRVVYAGLSEYETEQKRSKLGIPLHPEVIEWFKGACAELGIPFTLTTK